MMNFEKLKGPPRPPIWGNLKGVLIFLSFSQRLTISLITALCLIPSILQIQAPLDGLMLVILFVLGVMGLNPPSRRWIRVLQHISLTIALMSLCVSLTNGNPFQAALVAFMISQWSVNRTLQDAHRLLLVGLFALIIAFSITPSAWLLTLLIFSIFVLSFLNVWLLNALMFAQNHLKPSWVKLGLRPWILATLSSILILFSLQFFHWKHFDFQKNQAEIGLSNTLSPGLIQNLLENNETAFRVTFDGNPPPQKDWYWRGYVLSDFNGETWQISRFQNNQFIPKVQYKGPIYAYHWMPALSQSNLAFLEPILPSLAITLNSDLGPKALQPIKNTLKMRTQEIVSWPSLSQKEKQINLQLPPGNPKTKALALKWKSESQSDEQFISKALTYFQTHFRYTLTPPLLGKNQIDDFMFVTHEGFCAHFASALTVLLRDAGIPARVINGYWGGHWNTFGHYWEIRQSDAHAWVEVWIQKSHQWVRVDPTSVVLPLNKAHSSVEGKESWWNDLMDFGDYKIGQIEQIKAPDLTPAIPSLMLTTKTTMIILIICGVLLIFFIVQLLILFKAPKNPLDRALWVLEKRLNRLRFVRNNHETWISFANRICPELCLSQQSTWLILIQDVDLALYGPSLPLKEQRNLYHRLKTFHPKRIKKENKNNSLSFNQSGVE